MSTGAPLLVGREAELGAIERAARDARERGCRIVLVSGEPGIGKTQFLRAAERLTAADGFLTVRANCYDDRQAQPYAVVADLARDVLRRLRAVGAPHRPADLDSLAHVLPELDGEPATVPVADDEGLRRRRVATFARILLPDDAPRLLSIDDLHWIDDASLLVLRDLVRSALTSPLLILLTTRDESSDAPARTGDLLAEWYRERLLERLPLRPLSLDATRRLITAAIGSCAAVERPEVVRGIHDLSGGVPFYAEELARHVAEGGTLPQIDSGERDERSLQRAFPLGVREVIEARLASLPPAARALVEIAAVIGAAGEPALVERIAATLPVEGASGEGDWLLVARRAGLLALDDATEGDGWRFTHQLARRAVLESLGAAHRRAIHRSVAALLDERGAPAALVARHAAAGGDARRAWRAAERAARDAIAVQGWAEARGWLEQALTALEEVGGEEPIDVARSRFTLLRDREHVLEQSGDRAAQANAVADLLACAEPLDDAARVTALLRAARFAVLAGDDVAALTHARAAVAAAPDPHSRLRARIALAEAHAGRLHGEPASLSRDRARLLEARDAYREALTEAEALEDAALVGALHQELGVVEWALATSDEERTRARNLLAESLAAFRNADDRRGELTALIALAYRRQVAPSGQARTAGDSYVSFLEEIRRLRFTEHQLARSTDRDRAELLSLLSLELYARTHGWYEVALRRSEQAVRLADRRAEPRLAILARSALSEVERLLGNGARALVHAQRAQVMLDDRRTPASTARTLADGVLTALALAQLEVGDPVEALALARGRLDGEEREVRPSALAERAALLAEIEERAGQHAAARDSARLAVRVARDLAGSIAWDVRAELVLARCALADGDGRLALGHVTAALSRLEQRDLPTVSLRIRTDLTLAAALAAVGEPDEARAALARADERVSLIATRITDERLRSGYLERNSLAVELRALAERLGAGATASAPTAPAATSPLTPRETEVLRLVAAGRSNREIADELFISEKTVARHLTNTFTKIEVQSRTQAAAWAFRNGIV